MNKTTKFVKKEEINRTWHLIDASEYSLGRLATHVANLLNGKGKIDYTPNVDMGDFVVIINADNVKLTGNKSENKLYHHYSGYPGGLKSKSLKVVQKDNPQNVIIMAVKGMLNSNRHENNKLKRLKVYVGKEHPHQAQFESKK